MREDARNNAPGATEMHDEQIAGRHSVRDLQKRRHELRAVEQNNIDADPDKRKSEFVFLYSFHIINPPHSPPAGGQRQASNRLQMYANPIPCIGEAGSRFVI